MPEGPEIRREAARPRARPRRPAADPHRVSRSAPRAPRPHVAWRPRHQRHVAWQGAADRLLERAHALQPQPAVRRMARRRRRAASNALLDKRASSVRVLLQTSTHAAVLLSATQIELLNAAELTKQPYLSRLGPDVLDRSTTVATVARRLRHPSFARRSLAALLLDQGFLAGLGNYLRSDILHATGLRHTMRPADLSDDALARLARAILELPRQSLRTGGHDERCGRSYASSRPRASRATHVVSVSMAAKGCPAGRAARASVASTSAAAGSTFARAVSRTNL